MKRRFWLDGVPATEGAVSISIDAPLCRWGAGFFETALVHRGTIVGVDFHKARMRESLTRSNEAGYDIERFEQVWGCLVRDCQRLGTGRLRVTATPRSLENPDISYLASFSTLPDVEAEEVPVPARILRCSFPHPGLGSFGKSSAYHWALLGNAEARSVDADDVYYVRDEQVVETSFASILVREGSDWFTPPASCGGLASTTLAHLRAVGCEVIERTLPACSFRELDAVLLINSISIATPVRSIDGHPMPPSIELARKLRTRVLMNPTTSCG